MEVKDIFRYVVEEIHTSIMATTDEDGHPVTCAIDLMDCDDDSIYFLTATGKGFYKRLICSPHIALTALKGTDTMHSVAVSVVGEVRELGPELLSGLFEKNPYMYDIYPTEESRGVLTVFQIFRGQGEWFSLQTNFQLHFPGSNRSDRTDLFAITAADTSHRIDHRMPAIHLDAGARTGILAGSAADTAFLYFIRFAFYLLSTKCKILLLNPLCLPGKCS